MGKPRPAPAGGSATPAELLAQAEAALVGLSPKERAAAEEELDELRQAARAQAEAERQQLLAFQEAANHAASHGDLDALAELAKAADDAAAADATSAEKNEGGE